MTTRREGTWIRRKSNMSKKRRRVSPPVLLVTYLK
jgi:hypothetical protein